MKEGVDFYFGKNQGSDNGFRSVDYGIINGNISGGLFEEHYIPTVNLKETVVRGNPKPYFNGLEFEPIEFNLSFAFDSFNTGVTGDDKHKALRELSYWLTKPYYVPFGIIGQEYMFYVVSVGDSSLHHNGLDQGYVDVRLRTDAPWAYSDIKTVKWFGLNPNEENIVEFNNYGDLDVKPEIWIEMPFMSNGTNLTCNISTINGDYRVFEFKDLLSQEQIYVNNEKEYIESLNTNNYRYDNFNNNYLSLKRGKTKLSIRGAKNITIRYKERKFII